MKASFIKFSIRALASLGALLGLSMLFFGLILHLPRSITSWDGFGIGYNLFGILLGIYLSYVGFLACFRLSPVAVRHVLGMIAIILFGTIVRTLSGLHFSSIPAAVSAISFLVAALLYYSLYRWVVSYCCNQLFPAPLHDASPETRNA